MGKITSLALLDSFRKLTADVKSRMQYAEPKHEATLAEAPRLGAAPAASSEGAESSSTPRR